MQYVQGSRGQINAATADRAIDTFPVSIGQQGYIPGSAGRYTQCYSMRPSHCALLAAQTNPRALVLIHDLVPGWKDEDSALFDTNQPWISMFLELRLQCVRAVYADDMRQQRKRQGERGGGRHDDFVKGAWKMRVFTERQSGYTFTTTVLCGYSY